MFRNIYDIPVISEFIFRLSSVSGLVMIQKSRIYNLLIQRIKITLTYLRHENNLNECQAVVAHAIDSRTQKAEKDWSL